MFGGPVVSRMAGQPEDDLGDSQKNAFDWCKEGNIDRLKECVSPASVNTRDDQVWVGRYRLHLSSLICPGYGIAALGM